MLNNIPLNRMSGLRIAHVIDKPQRLSIICAMAR